MKKQTEEQIEESYNHINPYLKTEDIQKELYPMCSICECWYGNEHDYSECRNKRCFEFFLAYKYLEWENSWR